MPSDDIRDRIDTDQDFVNLKKFDYSLEKTLEHYPDGAPPKVVAQALMMSETEVEELYQRIISKLRSAMKVDSE